MHSVGGVHRQLVLARSRQNGLEVTRHSLEHARFRKRSVLAIRAAPQARAVELGDDGSVLRIDHERRARVAVALEVIINVRSDEALRPGQAIEL